MLVPSFFPQLALGMFPYPQVSFLSLLHPNISFILSEEQSWFGLMSAAACVSQMVFFLIHAP